jgi:hypothetical protein
MIVFVKAENWSLLWAGPLAREGERIQTARDRPQVRGQKKLKSMTVDCYCYGSVNSLSECFFTV